MSTDRRVATCAAREGYHEVPSVSPGGKTAFYMRRHPETDHRQWILWARDERRWLHHDEEPTTGVMTRWPFWTTEEE